MQQTKLEYLHSNLQAFEVNINLSLIFVLPIMSVYMR